MEITTGIDYKRLYESSQVEIVELKNQLKNFGNLQLQTLQLQQQLQQLRKMIYGSKQESFVSSQNTNPIQLSLDIQADSVATCSVIDTKQITYTRTKVSIEKEPLQHPGRMKLPEHLKREVIVIEPTQDISGCKKIGEEITEVLECEPGSLFVKKYVRAKYAKPNNEGILIGKLPSRPLEKSIAGPSLLAQIVIDKYVDHLPLNRQQQRFDRSGVKLPYSTIADWVRDTGRLIEPIYEALKKEVLQSPYLNVDETPIKVLDKSKKGKTHRGYYWVYQDSINKVVLFEYNQGRGREGPLEVLENFQGYLQTDGYNVYEIFDKKSGIALMHCMAHARRMFYEAMDNDKQRASYALEQIAILYHIEENCRDQSLNVDQIKTLRQEQSVPILEQLSKWMKEQYCMVTPKSSIGKALGYSIQRWERLMIYTQDGRLNIDNNPVENSIRPVALGRKNYLFAGSHEAAQRSAMLYSLLGTCKMHGIDPYKWLSSVLEKISDYPVNRVKELLPHQLLS